MIALYQTTRRYESKNYKKHQLYVQILTKKYFTIITNSLSFLNSFQQFYKQLLSLDVNNI